ncbi:hypothetical protein LR48_Vigan07g257000 [Vigna angularis]|uniref:DUF4408 domain-containing protein n=2 Tax=Phaseolus angularis TaxID=3914 RepID=A0A0L9V1N1_PHAAN|nr:pathogen-associated molecular patterns-induced protein A70 [Vigna angularis]KAG2390227.1 uncharacterized protein HKW66_Vig0223670 [Vigna angularis]KOM48866.1 hypothetical protein LR48_Vigan07g257000 [Vigna angularis]BAT82508.1 hypothetical protein VIGAN_03253700 [Vigna angularis var. angularis]
MLEEAVSSSPTFLATLYSWFTPTVFFLLLQLVIGTIFIISNLASSKHHHHHQDPHAQHHQANDFPQPHLPRSPSILQRLKSINFYSSQDPPFPHFHESQTQNHTHENESFQLARSPSLLQRLKSINFYTYLPTEPFTSKLTLQAPQAATLSHAPDKSHLPPPQVVETDEEKEEDDDFPVVSGGHDYSLGDREEGSSLDEIYSKLQQQGQDGHFTRTHSDTKPSSGEVPVKLPRKMKKSASSKSAFAHFKEEDIVENRRPATVREAKVNGAVVDDEVDAKADDFINKFKQQLKLQRLDSIMRYKEMIGRGSAK